MNLNVAVKKVVVLDVDGVLFRNKKILSHVSNKAVKYIQDNVPNFTEFHAAYYFNNMIYKSYGHTARGLSIIYNNPYEIRDFNEYIYNSSMIDELKSHLVKNVTEIKNIKKELVPLLNHCKENDISIYLLSNAPSEWCVEISDVLSLHIPFTNIITSDWILFNHRLKPDRGLYNDVYNYIEFKEKEKVFIYYIDDSEINLHPLKYSNDWKPILFKDNFKNVMNYIN